MNWEAIGTTAEVVGAIGVIFSLIYLAIQVRQSTKQEEFDSLNAAIKLFLNNVDRSTQTKESSEIFRNGLNRFNDLSPNEQGAFHSTMHSWLHGFHGIWILHKHGALPDYELVAMRRLIVELLLSPGGRQWWNAFKHIPPPHLVSYLDDEAAKAEGVIPPAIDTYPWLRAET